MCIRDSCNDHDATDLDFDLSQRSRDSVNDFFLYFKNRLIGYLGLFPRYTTGEIAVNGVVHPEYRRKGVFSALYHEAIKTCHERNKNVIVFIVERASESGKAFALSKGSNLKYTDYDMEMDINDYRPYVHELEEFIFRTAANADIDDIVALGMQGFGTTDEEERPIIESSIKDSDTDVYVGIFNDTTVGTISVIREKEQAIICGLVVDEGKRGKGYGKRLLTETVNEIVHKGYKKICLSVDVENLNALLLYENCGFKTVKAVDFYELRHPGSNC
jgi:ribosomal protein S18 acetylase RimI-like enzyme